MAAGWAVGIATWSTADGRGVVAGGISVSGASAAGAVRSSRPVCTTWRQARAAYATGVSAVGDAIRANTLDADGTLWDFEATMHAALGHALAELRRAAPTQAAALTIEHLIATRNAVEARLFGRVPTLEVVRLSAFEETLRQIGLDDRDGALAARLNALYLHHRFADIALYADVRPALAALRGRYVLGLLTNGNTYPERCGLPDTFDFAVFGQDHGTKKPDRGLFRIALDRAGCAPHQLLHVGDSLANDVAGANGAGARSVWLNRTGRANDTPHVPDNEIASLSDLGTILDR